MADEVVYGGFWRRMIAGAVDCFLVSIFASIAAGLLNLVIDLGWFDPSILFTMQTVFIWFYFALFESSQLQATPGKKVLDLRVTDMDCTKISFLTATTRFFGKFLGAMLLFTGILAIAFTAKKQGLHDMLAGTLVVKTS